MGMTIDEANNTLEEVKEFDDSIYQHNKKYLLESFNVALDTMRKYQKIQEIYQWVKDRSYTVEADDIMDKLKEVVEDGTN